MAEFDFTALSQPLDGAAPCGPDLDREGDLDYMNFVAKIEGLLPESFFAFKRTDINFEAEFGVAKPILARTRDLRLFVILAKLLILNRDLQGFRGAVEAISGLLKNQWDQVHPRGEDDEFGSRLAILQTLDDLPRVVLPLQFAPLVEHRRLGPLSYRSHLIADNKTPAREGETVIDRVGLDQAFVEVDLSALIAARDASGAIETAVKAIDESVAERLGAGNAPSLDKLATLATSIQAMLDQIVARRDPSSAKGLVAPASAADESTPNAPRSLIAAGSVTSPARAAAALAAAAAYFGRAEPSNPALLIIRRAEELIGKSFVDVMRVLMPTQVDSAAAHIGRDQFFDLPLASISVTAPADVDVPEAPSMEAEPSPTAAVSEDSPAAQTNAAVPPAVPSAAPAGAPLTAHSRQDAIALLEQVAGFYRSFEPSSPIPLLAEAARGMVNRDFLSILKELLPPDALRSKQLES